MDEVTRKAALKKIDAMKSIAAYPDELRTDSLVEQYYSELEVTPDQYLGNILNLQRTVYKNVIESLRTPIIDRNDWRTISNSIAIINAFYWHNFNTIGNDVCHCYTNFLYIN